MEQYLYMYIFFLIHIYADICFLLKKNPKHILHGLWKYNLKTIF